MPPTDKWKNGVWDMEAFRHGSMTLEIFAPKGTDFQTPHTQDEVYFIVQGSGMFTKEGKHCTFSAGDVLFVEAGKDHRFENFSDDLVAWVIFYGSEGGEKCDKN